MSAESQSKRVILLSSSLSYRAEPFRAAAERLGLRVTLGLDMPDPLAEYWSPTLPVDFKLPQPAAQRIFEQARADPIAAIIPVDDGATIIAALASEMLDLSYNSPEAAYNARNKYAMRQALTRAGVPSPHSTLVSVDDDPHALAAQVRFPCVVKPTMLSGSQGVIRADNAEEFVRAFQRAGRIARNSGGANDENADREYLLIEEYIPGFEVALEGILLHGQMTVLSLFDKPDPLDGPYFEETIYVTPSRLPAATQDAIADCAAQACRAIGLREGPVHAELRVNERGPWVVEVAGRSIGGL